MRPVRTESWTRELRWLYDRRDFAEARRDLAAWLARWQATYPKLCVGKVCVGVEAPIEETLTFYRLPREHHKHPKSTNLLERLNEAIKRQTHMVRIFPNGESCLHLIRALAVERHENWPEAHRYLNIDDRREHKKEGPAHGGMTRTRSHSPQGPPTATMTQFAEHSGQNSWSPLHLPLASDRQA